MWKNPILEFIDKHCLQFDDEDENKLEYTAIHNVMFSLTSSNSHVIVQDFKKLVDGKLEKFIKELGIDSDVFVTACELASEKIHKSIVNQLLAVENFLLFKRMMLARNK